MTKNTRKIWHSVGVAFVGVLTDIGAQLMTATTDVNYPRAVIVGMIMGAVARLMGAYFAATAASDAPSE